MNSLDIAKECGKDHNKLLRDIRRLIQRNPELQSEFIVSSYINKRNREDPCMKRSIKGYESLREKYKYKIRSARFEYKMLNELCDFFDELHIKYIKQYYVLSYKIDLFLPDYNLSVEYDEDQHKFKQKYDKNRENNIKDILGCEFVRIKENETVGTAIGRILKEIGGDIFNERKDV